MEINLDELTNEELFALRNQVVAESEHRIAKLQLADNLRNALSAATTEAEADAAYNTAKAELFNE